MFPYVKLLVKLRIAAWNPINYFGLDRSRRRSILQVVGITASIAMLAGYLIWMEVLLFNAFVQRGEPETMLALAVVSCTLLMVFTSFFYVLSELFFSKDLLFVSALPIPSRQLLMAKLIRVWLGEAVFALVICLPVVVLYGIHADMGVLYYVSGALLTVLVPLVPIAAVTLLSFVLIRISALWKHSEKLTVVASVLFLIAIIWFQLQWTSGAKSGSMNGLMVQLVASKHTVFDMFARIYPPAEWFCTALTAGGTSALFAWLGFTALNLGGLGLVAWALGGRYQQLAIRQSETLVRAAVSKRRAGKLAVRTPLLALYRREIREIFASPTYALNCLATSIVFPVIYAAAFMNKQGNGRGLSELIPLLDTFPVPIVLGVLTAMFALAGSMNMAVATSVSREGKRHDFFRTLPVPAPKILLAKLLMGMTLGVIGSLPSAVLLAVFIQSLGWYALIGFLPAMLFILCTSLIGLTLDISHPKYGWKTETEAIKQNGMATLAMFGGMGLIAACGFLYYFLMQLGLSPLATYLAVCSAVLAADVILFKRLSTKSAQTYLLQEVKG
jgi:ABC-2 type transport system permease protein